MNRRKNTKRIDPRWFMDEKTDIIKEEVESAGLPKRQDGMSFEEFAKRVGRKVGSKYLPLDKWARRSIMHMKVPFTEFAKGDIEKLGLHDQWAANKSVEEVANEIGTTPPPAPIENPQHLQHPNWKARQAAGMNYPKRLDNIDNWYYDDLIAKGEWRD